MVTCIVTECKFYADGFRFRKWLRDLLLYLREIMSTTIDGIDVTVSYSLWKTDQVTRVHQALVLRII